MHLKIASININGFRSKRKQTLVKQFASQNQIDILLLQETFVDNIFLAKSIEQNLDLNRKCIWNFGKADSCGVAILLFNENICIENFHIDLLGRVIRLDFSADGYSNFRIVNAYFPNDTSARLEFIKNFSQYLNGAKNLIVGGDFNFILDSNLDKIGGNLDKGTVGSRSFKTLLEKVKLIDCFRHLYPNKKSVTWVRKNVATGNERSNYDIMGSRLDRFYISSLVKDMVIGFDTLPCVCSDHDYIVLNLVANNGINIGKSYWKFNNSLIDDEDFNKGFNFFLKLETRTEQHDLDWWDGLKLSIKNFCIDYSKARNKNLYGELKELKSQFSKLNINSESHLHVLHEIKEKISILENKILQGTIVRSKACILECNEKPSKYFFQKEISRGQEKIVKSVIDNNITYSTSSDILNCFKHFYENLYSNEPVDNSLNHLFLSNLPQVKSEFYFELNKNITKEEIFNALKEMEPNKSPGCDGLSSALYLKFFDIFGPILEDVINLAYEQNSLSMSQKMSYITLICKDKNNSTDMKNYRPISLLNIDYKIISKVLTTRLGKILPDIIHMDQTCAVKGRTIFDNVHLLRNIIDYVDQKNLGACFICLDQEKAFDRVSWSYLYDTLAAFGFPQEFVRWIQLLYTDISSSVIVNNYISNAFPVNRGVRQGCSLSMLLYVICFEPFANKIRSLTDIQGLKLPGTKLETKISLYADDSTGIFTNDSSVNKYLYWVGLFGKVSGSKINYSKSKGLYLGKWKTRSDHPFGISWVKFHKILGFNFGTGYNVDDDWSKVFLKFSKTLELWKMRKLSLKGKSTVLNTLCLSKILYHATAKLIPSHYDTLLTRSMFRFVWQSKYEPVSRDTLYLSFANGGLNIPNLKLKCQALYLSHLQKLIGNYEAKWTYFAKYWIGLQLRKYNASFQNNLSPHSEYIPPFYCACLDTFKSFTNNYPDFNFVNSPTKVFYNMLINTLSIRPKVEKNYPQIDFKLIWKNMYMSCIDPEVRNTYWKLCHDIMYVNYYLHSKHISKIKTCPMCGNIETVRHLFLECKFVGPLNRVVLFLLRKMSNNQISFSELVFRFSILPLLPKRVKEICLILLSESRNIIWLNRNLCKYENKNMSGYSLVSQFLNKLKFRILADKIRMSFEAFIENWCIFGLFCGHDLTNDSVIFHPQIEIDYYFRKSNI